MTTSFEGNPMPPLNARFDIDKSEGAAYGYRCWRAFWESIDLDQLEGCDLYDGDSQATLAGDERVFLIRVEGPRTALQRVRESLQASPAYQAMAAAPLFSNGDAADAPLVRVGRCSGGEVHFSGDQWAEGALNEHRQRRPEAPLASQDSDSSYVTNCLACSGTGRAECSRCDGSGRVGGILGLWTRDCPLCGGRGEDGCEQCLGTGREESLVPPERPAPGEERASTRTPRTWPQGRCAHCRTTFQTLQGGAYFGGGGDVGATILRMRKGCDACGKPVCFDCAANAADEQARRGHCLCPACGADLD